MAIVLQAQSREDLSKSNTKGLRRTGNIPAVLYGNGVDSRAIFIDGSDFIKVIRKAGRNGVITMKIDGEDYPVMLHEYQTDTIKDELLHADFYKVDMSSEVDADVNVHLVGESAGQKEGGVVQHLLHEITVRALPADIPEAIEVNIEKLEIGDSLSIKDLAKTGNYEILNDVEETIVSVTPPQAEEPEDTTDEEITEPELVDAEKDGENGEGEEE
ncbi:MAG TPA: 50S ribosomal protein L25/general stress protein Ctc [Bacillales bacterium]|nr:50S ribosomal protein L25/general stress protein Ctc [Bacillales bacterium]